MANIIEELKLKISGKGLKIVFPESHDKRILEAALKLCKEGLVVPVLIGNTNNIPKKYDISHCEMIDPNNYDDFDNMVDSFVKRRKGKVTVEEARKMLLNENYFGTMLVYMKKVDGLVSGATRSTGDTVRPALQIIKTKPGISRTF
ncbi:MAG: phosphate acetyltransferase, partial [Candidatus Izimaplasma sp.]|nr:phosphate acetyltransferase [Candidatus Izimaplasma bacterium]